VRHGHVRRGLGGLHKGGAKDVLRKKGHGLNTQEDPAQVGEASGRSTTCRHHQEASLTWMATRSPCKGQKGGRAGEGPESREECTGVCRAQEGEGGGFRLKWREIESLCSPETSPRGWLRKQLPVCPSVAFWKGGSYPGLGPGVTNAKGRGDGCAHTAPETARAEHHYLWPWCSWPLTR
jgi:hypothetical protein